MGFRGNNERTFAEYVELDIAVNDDSPNAYIYKRLDSETNKPVSERTWYVGIPIPNKGNGKRLSLRTSDLSNAKKKALQKVVNIMSDLDQGVDVCGSKVQVMIDEFLSKKFINVRPEMMGEKEGGSKSITKDRYDNIKGKLKNYFIPFVGANTIATNLKPKEFEEWEYWRRQEENWAGVGKKKKAPCQSTIGDEITLFREVWRWGVKKGFIRASLDVPFDDHNFIEDEKVKRDTWELNEWKEFLDRESDWYALEQNSEDQDRVWESFVAHQLIQICACSGLRPKEWSLLKWKDVKDYPNPYSIDEDDKWAIEMKIHPSTKTGQREAYSTGGIWFRNIYEKTKFKSKNDWIFTDLEGNRLEPDWFSDIFNGEGNCNGLIAFTNQYKLTGKELVPYSLRHFYASQSIYDEVPEDIIADNMGITKTRLNRSYKHCFLRVRTKRLFSKKGSQVPIKQMRTFGTGQYAFFTGTMKQKDPSSSQKSRKLGLSLSRLK